VPGSDGAGSDRVRLGLIAAPGIAEELARQLAEDLPAILDDEVASGVAWELAVVIDALDADRATGGIEIIDRARDLMLREGWNLALCLTDLPLRIGHRPVVADASATHGVGLICLPALGALQLRRRARDAAVRLLDGLVGESLERGRRDDGGGGERRARVARRMAGVAASVRRIVPDDDDVDMRFVAAVVRGNLRLLAGMVRANRPWRLIVGLSRAMAAALGAVVFALVTSDIWRLADALGPVRLAILTVGSVGATVVSLMVAHALWEHASAGRSREQVVLFNAATVLTVALGVLTMYAALFAVTLGGAELVVSRHVLAASLGHAAGFGDYAGLAWMVSSLATVGGALGAGLESDAAVREAAYGYRPERETERASRAR
jgi:hypothetical protein